MGSLRPLPPPTITKWTRAATTRVGEYGVFGVDRHAMTDAKGGSHGDFFTLACRDWCNVVWSTLRPKSFCERGARARDRASGGVHLAPNLAHCETARSTGQ